MDIPLVIRRRLRELGLEQRALAVAAQVTESYISQLLAGKKAPPAPNRTGVYEKMERFLKLPRGKLSKLADAQRKQAVKKRGADPTHPLFPEFRELILRKCATSRQKQVRAIVEREPFGELERLVTQTLLDVAKGVATEELDSEKWLRLVARLGKRSYERAKSMILEFLDMDVFSVSAGNSVVFLDLLIESWEINLETFGLELVLNPQLTLGHLKRFEFVERDRELPSPDQVGLEEFLRDPLLSGDATEDEVEFLKSLRFSHRRPTALYYYRELQNLRDPLHFAPAR